MIYSNKSDCIGEGGLGAEDEAAQTPCAQEASETEI